MRALGTGFVPRVVTDMKDARIDVDDRLRSVIGDLVGGWATRMAAPLTADTRGRSDARTGSAEAEAGASMRETVEREVPLVRKKLDEYLGDARTKEMLLRAVLDEVLVRYGAWLEAKGLEGQGRRGAKGKGREDQVWEQEAFGEWAAGVFGLGEADDDDEEDSR